MSDFSEFKLCWHSGVREDLKKIPRNVADSLIRAVDRKLSTQPLLCGIPLRGTENHVWRIPFARYRILYTLNSKTKEVWVLAVVKRENAYRQSALAALVKIAKQIQIG